jgi:phosphatidyl-myo-inositol alpha-mannosyltransferase
VRVALVSPYSFTYPGGVGRHVEALAGELFALGHEVRLLAPYDPPDRRSKLMHRGAAPEPRALPDYVVPLGRTVGIPANGAVSNLSVFADGITLMRRELRHGRFDVVHIHEPNVPVVSWSVPEAPEAPKVGTFHTYANRPVALGIANLIGMRRQYNRLAVRIAVSEAARWTAERFAGGHYRIIPNGVDLSAAPQGPKPLSDELKILFLGRAEERKGLPVLLRAFEALHGAGIPAQLQVAGATREEVEPYLLDETGVEILGRVTDDEKWQLLHDADLLCAPSLGGESFGMVLTEAFACGTPAVASNIAGYRDVLRNGLDGVLVPAGDAVELAETLALLATDRASLDGMSQLARQRAERFAWPHVAEEVTKAYEDAVAVPQPATSRARLARRTGLTPSDGLPAKPARRLPSLEPELPGASRRKALKVGRRIAVGAGGVAGVGLAALALQRIGWRSIGDALIAATPTWVLLALGLMCVAMLLRAESWHAVLEAALPRVRVRRRDAARATMIGVLMSATLPARLGEPSRALILSRRVGRVRERFPVVLGTLVSQTLLNLLALVVLGTVMFATIGIFKGHEKALIFASIAPATMLALVLAMPALLRKGKPGRFQRVAAAVNVARRALMQVRQGLQVFRRPRLGAWAAVMQLLAWTMQWLACYVLLIALGLDHHVGMGAAAAVLFAVNVTAVLPATPSNLGVFQAACVAVLSAYGVSHADALAYGIILQAVEIATALALGMPALLREGVTWKDLRLRAIHTSPVEISLGSRRAEHQGAELEA